MAAFSLRPRRMINIISVILFAIIFIIGFFLSLNKPFWLDEYYSLTSSIAVTPYSRLWLGQLPQEGNNSPLFYVSEKLLLDSVSYDPHSLTRMNGRHIHHLFERTPANHSSGLMIFPRIYFYYDAFSTSFFRLISIFFMALASAVFFGYFARRFSIWWGAYAFLLCLSSWHFWWYGLEARPYIHLFALSEIQLLCFLELIKRKNSSQHLWLMFSIVNITAALTITLGFVQLAVIGLFMIVYERHRLTWARGVAAFMVPAGIVLFYSSQAVQLKLSFFRWPQDFVFATYSFDTVLLTGIFLIYAYIATRKDSITSPLPTLAIASREINRARGILFLTVVVPSLYVIMITYLWVTQPSRTLNRVYFYDRYLIALVPLGITTMVYLGRTLLRALPAGFLKYGFVGILVLILAARLLITYSKVHFWVGF